MSDGLYPLPNGWEWRKLPQVVRIGCLKGFIPTIIDGKVPFIGMSDIDEKNGRKSKYILEDFEKVSSGKTKFEKNAILVGKITPCTQNNKISIVPNDIDGGYATTEVFALHCSKTVEPLYLNYFLRDNQINKILVESMVGATGRQRVPTETLANLDIPLPPLDEQKRIVGKLDGLFAKIDKAIALLDESIASASALIPSALNEVFGELSEKYHTKTLGEIASVGTGVTPLKSRTAYYENGKINWITSKVTNDDFVTEAEQTISEIALKECRLKVYPIGTLIVALYGQGKTRGQVSELSIESTINQAIASINVFKNNSSLFVKYFLKKSYFELREKASGGTQENLNLSIIKAIKIPLPPIDIQAQTVAHLDAVREKSERLSIKLKTQRDELVALKASLLERAFKGEL